MSFAQRLCKVWLSWLARLASLSVPGSASRNAPSGKLWLPRVAMFALLPVTPYNPTNCHARVSDSEAERLCYPLDLCVRTIKVTGAEQLLKIRGPRGPKAALAASGL